MANFEWSVPISLLIFRVCVQRRDASMTQQRRSPSTVLYAEVTSDMTQKAACSQPSRSADATSSADVTEEDFMYAEVNIA